MYRLVVLLLAMTLTTPALAKDLEGHGPSSSGGFSHRFQLAPHDYAPQVNVHYGLSQPLLFGGFNAAVDVRLGRFVLEYSHGTNLDYDRVQGLSASFLGASGVSLKSPWTTGAGLGYTVVDDLYVMLEAKVHHYEMRADDAIATSTTVSLGPALAYRLFVWRGLNLTAYARYWPNIWTSSPRVELGGRSLNPVHLGLFGNLSIGWSFDL